MLAWDAYSIQLVWFSAEAHRLDASDLYRDALSHEPTATNKNAIPTPANPRFSSAYGEANDIAVEVAVQFGRVDFVVQRPSNEAQLGPKLFQDTEGLIRKASDWAQSLTGRVSSVNRIALVSNLGNFSGSHKKCTQTVNSSIGNPIDFDDASDLSFQVNRRIRRNEFIDLEINRLIRFSVIQMQQVYFDAAGTSVANSQGEAMASFFVDINTVPTTREISHDEQISLWKYMADEVIRLRSIGNIHGLRDHD